MEETTDSEEALLSCAGSSPATVMQKIIAINIRDKRIRFALKKKIGRTESGRQAKPELQVSRTRGNGL
jgi:hypothetical protein